MPPKDDPAATSVRFCSKKKRDGPKKGSGSVRPGPSPCIGYTELPSKTPKEPVTHGLASSLLRARFCRVVDKFFFPEKLSFFYTSILPSKKKNNYFPDHGDFLGRVLPEALSGVKVRFTQPQKAGARSAPFRSDPGLDALRCKQKMAFEEVPLKPDRLKAAKSTGFTVVFPNM
jgi:hypothetical protein